MIIKAFREELIPFIMENEALLRSLGYASLAFFLLTPLVAPLLIVLMPADTLIRKKPSLRDRKPLRRISSLLWHVIKNLAAVALMVLGVILLFIPGQGILTIFAGLLLTDLPGKKYILHRLLGSGRIKPLVNRLRGKYRREPLLWPDLPGKEN